MGNIVKTLKKYDDLLSTGGASKEAVEEAEKELGLKFSSEYKKYLLEFGSVVVDGHELTGITTADRLNVVKATLKAKSKIKGIGNALYLVEDLNMDGILIWQDASGTIYESTADGMVSPTSDSLEEYMSE